MTIQEGQIISQLQNALTQVNLIEQHNYTTTELRFILEDLIDAVGLAAYPEPEDLGELYEDIPYEERILDDNVTIEELL